MALELVESLPAETAAARTRLGLNVAVQAAQMGVAKTTLTRLEAGSVPTQSTIIAALRWLAEH